MDANCFKVLTYRGNFVDEGKLAQGIYGAARPSLHPSDTTLDKMIDHWESCRDLANDMEINLDNLLSNLKKCKIETFHLVRISQN